MEPKIVNIVGSNINIMSEKNTKITNLELIGTLFIGAYSYINSGFCRSYVEIGRYSSIGRNVSLGLGEHNIHNFTTSSLIPSYDKSINILVSTNPKRRLIIGNDVWIGDGVFIKSGITIGNGAVIGANCVVTKDVPPYSVVVGVPGKVIKKRFSDEIIQKLLELKWWNYKNEEIIKWNDFNKGNISNMINNSALFLKTIEEVRYSSYTMKTNSI